MATFLVILFVVLNAIDVLVTMYALSAGLHEKNPIVHLIIRHIGIIGLLTLKALIIIALVYFVSSFSIESLVLLNVIYVLVLLNNMLKLYMHKENL